ncbi:hypothetical protein GGX14DRAFT_406579 [Mycena pura]|uniref:Uncharacterized protein n=1 Tax=Mycena pura TaxID=153505 RepID=A0AAD6UU62_9AGAR|nr:hypothetical protein GGX14DRAFT_406579 [Mycena pura]
MSSNSAPTLGISKHPQASSKSKPDWLGPALLTVQMATASAEMVPFPCVKGVFGTIKTVLETVVKVKKNQNSLKELCEDITEITKIIGGKITEGGDKMCWELEGPCTELDDVLQDVLDAVHKMQKTKFFFKAMLMSTEISDDIAGYQEKIRKLRDNFMVYTHF